MDYGVGTHLTHAQWKIMHARKPAYSWFDSEEDGALWGRLFSKTFKGKLVFENMVKSVDFLQKTNSRPEVVILKQALAIFGYYPGNNPKNPPANWISVPTAYINNPLFDDVTKQMVEDFQRNHYSANNLQLLVIDGIVGKETLETLDLCLWYAELQNPLTTLISAIKAQLFKDVFNLSALTNDYNALSANEKAEKKVTLAELWVKLYDISNRTGCMIIGNGTGNYKVVENGNTNIEIVSLSASEQDLFDWLMRRGRDKYGARLIDILPQLEKFYNDNMGNGNFCRFCPITKIITPDACTAMEDLYTRAGSTVNAENAIKKLCAKNSGFGYMSTYNGSITSQSEWIIIADLLALTNNEIIAFFDDIIVNTPNNNHIASTIAQISGKILEAWDYLYKNQEDKAFFARKNWQALNSFAQLNADVKSYIVKFGDKSSTMTLTKFCLDLDKNFSSQDPQKFLTYCNDVENLNIVKNFVGHKLNDTDFERVSEEYIDNSLNGLAKTWTQRSIKMAALQENGEDGRFYGKRAVVALINGTLDLGITTIMQSEYTVFNEVQLWVDKSKDQYMIADILLVKFNTLGQIDDIIICESKLSAGTDYTKRQKQGWRLINAGTSLEVKANKKNSLSNGGEGNIELRAVVSILNISSNKVKRISDAGNKNGAFNVANIPISNYSTYQAKN